MENFDLAISQAQISEEPILKFFAYKHLSNELLREVSASFSALAHVVMQLPRGAERAAALRKLLEAKDCAVRAAL
jgi:hypothetical protein